MSHHHLAKYTKVQSHHWMKRHFCARYHNGQYYSGINIRHKWLVQHNQSVGRLRSQTRVARPFPLLRMLRNRGKGLATRARVRSSSPMLKYYKMATFVKYAFLMLLSTLSRCGESFTDSNQVYKLQWPGSHSEVSCFRTWAWSGRVYGAAGYSL